jgi:hypothetical protein
MERCGLFLKCSANLCPLDPDLKIRVWYADEDICRSHIYGKHRWIKKQRSIQRRKTKSWFGHPVTQDDLFAASRKKVLSEKHLQELKDRMTNIRLLKTKNPLYNEIKAHNA